MKLVPGSLPLLTAWSVLLTLARLALASPIAEMPPVIVGRADDTTDLPFFILGHSPLLQTRMDPIISPGGVSGHVHAIVGSSAFQPTYTYENSRSGQCTTAPVSIDKSNYWVPQIYRHETNGTFTLVPFKGANTYYLSRRNGADDLVYEFPPGFRSVAGNPYATTYNATSLASNAARFACLGVDGPETHEFPPQSCPGGLRAEIFFPNCWDGKNAWLEGSAHVSYPSEGQYDGGGKCPDTHPYRLMSLFYEFFFEDDYEYREQARVFAQGDYVGYGMHGDFSNGWPVGTLAEIWKYGAQCSVSGIISNCPTLQAANQNGNGSNCIPEKLMVDEEIGENGPLTALPGNNPLWGGTTTGTPIPNYTETAQFTPVGYVLPKDWQRVGCIAEVSGRALKADSLTDDAMTPKMCMQYCAGKGYTLAGVEYSKECWCDNQLDGGASESNTLPASSCALDCGGMTMGKGYCGGDSTLTVYKWVGSGTPTVQDGTASQIAPTPTPQYAQVIADNIHPAPLSGIAVATSISMGNTDGPLDGGTTLLSGGATATAAVTATPTASDTIGTASAASSSSDMMVSDSASMSMGSTSSGMMMSSASVLSSGVPGAALVGVAPSSATSSVAKATKTTCARKRATLTR